MLVYVNIPMNGAEHIITKKVTFNGILYNYMGQYLELRDSAKVEVVGNTTGDDIDHWYSGYRDGLSVTDDEEQPEGSEFAYKITITNAE